MKNITLDKLRTLAAAVADAEQGSKAWDKATDALSAKFSSQCLVNLIDQLEAAQRDAQQLEAANISLDAESCKFLKRAEAAEAEIKRRDDAVPVAWQLLAGNGKWLDIIDPADAERYGYTVRPLYAAAHAAVLPPDNVTYFAFSPDYGFDFFKNKQDAINTAQEEIDGYREDRDDGWDEDVRRVAWGVVVQQAQGFDAQGKHHNHSEHTYQTCEYRLEPPLPGGGDV